MKRYLFVLLALCFCLSAIAQNDIVHLKILQTSDIHGAIFDYDFVNDRPTKTSLMNANTYIKAEREKFGEHLLLLDGGDNLQGQPAVYYYNFIDTTNTHLLARVMNAMRYDAAVVGNHDIETGHAVYDKIRAEYNFPLLAANAVKKDGTPYFVPYKIFVRDGLKIAVLGMTNPHIPSWLPEVLWSGMTFHDIIISSEYWVKYITETEQPDVLIGLIHAGAGDGSNSEENPSLYLAENVSGFDVIFIGHDHRRGMYKVANTKGDSVLIMDPANAVRYLSEVEIIVDKKTKAKTINGNLIDVSKFNVDTTLQNQFAQDFSAIKTFVSKPIGIFEKTITTRDAYFGSSAFVDLIHRIQLDIANADISFVAPLSFDTEIKKGIVYVRDMFNLYRFENMLYTMELSGSEIKGYLNYSYGIWLNQMQSPDDNLLLFSNKKEGAKGGGNFVSPPYNFDSAAGIIYEVDVTKPTGSMVRIISMADGSEFSETKMYRVAINSYRGNGGGGHLEEGAKISPTDFEKRMISSTEIDLRYYLMQWIEEQKVVDPQPLYQWKIVPEAWTNPAAQRDYEILFGR